MVPFPPRRDATHGGRVIAQLLMRLAERHETGLIYLRRSRSDPIEPELAARLALVEEVEAPRSHPARSRWRHRLDVLLTPLTGVPAPVASISEPRLLRHAVEAANSWMPDVVQVEHDQISHCGPALRRGGFEGALILTCHEPGLLASADLAAATRGRQRLSHRLDVAAWRRYWTRTLPSFDAVVTFTEADRDVIAEEVEGTEFATIGLATELPPEPLSATGSGEPSVLFVGGYQHPPNSDAAVRLISSIMPAVRRRLPGLPLLLVGAHPDRRMIRTAGPADTVTGQVESVAPYVDAASLLVLPIRLGGGMRVKLLEGLAAGKAVVASRLAAAGLELTDGRDAVLAESDEEFTDAIVRLIEDEPARGALGRAAREWALANLGWDTRVARYEELYRSLLASREA